MVQNLKRKIKKVLRSGDVPTTFKEQLESFEQYGTEREWQQIMMYSHVMNLSRDIPGDIVEFGVASGSSLKALIRMNNILNKSRHHDISKKTVYGFDAFEGLPDLDKDIDLAKTGGKEFGEMRKGGFESQSTLPALLQFIEDHYNCEIVKGWYDQSIPEFLKKNPHFSCSLIHIDCDIYSSTKTVLDAFIKRLNVGGVILFDEIFHHKFPGETEAFWEIYNQINDQVSKI